MDYFNLLNPNAVVRQFVLHTKYSYVNLDRKGGEQPTEKGGVGQVPEHCQESKEGGAPPARLAG